MRRSRVAVSGIVCALVVESTLFAGCHSREEETQRLAEQSVQKKPESKQKQEQEQPPQTAMMLPKEQSNAQVPIAPVECPMR